MGIHRALPLFVMTLAMSWRPSMAESPGPAFLVADLAGDSAPMFFDPSFLAVFQGSMYFAGRTETSGKELWRTDGTAEGTELVADLCAGACDSMGTVFASALFADALYFAACTDTDCRLWQTDGEIVSPVLVGTVQDILVWEGSLFFTTREGDLRRLVDDASSELLHHFDRVTPAFFVAGDGVFFVTAWFPTLSVVGEPSEIWRSDGTAAGTFFLSEMPQEELFAFPFDGKAVFKGPDTRLWVGDAFDAEPLLEEPPFASPEPVTAIDDVLFVRAQGRALWRTDGTPEGTFPVFEPAAGDGFVSFEAAAYQGELYFSFGATSRLLHRTSGLAGPEVFLELPEPVASLTVLGETLYVGTGSPRPVNLWRTLGSPETTSRVFESAADSFNDLAAFDDVLLLHLRDSRGSRLGRFAAGHDRVEVLSEPPGGASSRFREIFRHRDGVLIETDVQGWWRSDGTAPGTERLPAGLGLERGGGVALGDEAFVATSSGFVTVGGDGAVVRLFGGTGSVVPGVLEETAAGLVFLTIGSLPSRRVDLWVGDRGSGEAEVLVRDLQGFTNLLGEVETARLDDGDVLLFIEGALWRTDGTAEGTRELLDLSDACADCELRGAARAGSRVFFESSGPSDPTPRLWRTDGTPEGTVPVRAFPPGEQGRWHGLTDMTALGERIFFVISGPGGLGRELWTSDGTETGTRLARDVWPGGDADPSDLTPIDGRLVFVADDGVHGRELWTSDGTPEGTALFLDLLPGPRSSSARQLRSVDGRLLFATDDGVHGLELWVSDGTPRGTRLVQDVNPGKRPSDPRLATASGELAFFSAGDEATGFELWAVPRDALFEALEAAFVASRERAVQAKPVAFRDTSAGRPDSWCWRFGDEHAGAPACSARTRVARHRFLQPGTYTVQLTVERRLPSGRVETDRTTREVEVGAICRRCGGLRDGVYW